MLLLASFALLAVFAVNAQGGGGYQPKPIPERVKAIMDKLADFKLDKDKSALADSAFTNYFKAGQKNARRHDGRRWCTGP